MPVALGCRQSAKLDVVALDLLVQALPGDAKQPGGGHLVAAAFFQGPMDQFNFQVAYPIRHTQCGTAGGVGAGVMASQFSGTGLHGHKLAFRRQGDQPLDFTPELTDVPGPWVVLQQRHHLG